MLEEKSNSGMRQTKVLIVGAGVTGSYVASIIAKHYGSSKVAVELWDKGRGIGGRMSTSRMSRDSKLTCDLGAQYFSVTKQYWEKHKSVHEDLLANDILRPLTSRVENMKKSEEGTQHFVAPKGSASIPKYFISKSEAVIKTSTLLKQIDFHDNKAVAMGDSDDVICHADVVVVTIPTPQILNLKGDFENIIKPFTSGLQNVQYSSRYVMGLFFAGISNIEGIDWSAKYIYDNPCIRYVALDTKKRDQECEEGLSMVVHTSVPFSIPLIDHQFDQVEPTVLDNLKQVIPNLPEPTSKKFMRWRYSQVSKPYNGGEQGCLVVKDSSPLVILAGDAFTHSNLDGCISFGDRVFDIIRKSIES
uniref:Amine oxidase domain-containing protein n=1 Tax=Clytia hemisphaerica TaxID=252671 RepID=A0A7M5WQ83_9CNID